ncbi:MAG: hypothetical protein KatS3mg124_0245 [Porticoccaceae bacterium]|nr:MAG: hypothetical protein KatS3mg124_0245 [Porticoccaceae bacterium]
MDGEDPMDDRDRARLEANKRLVVRFWEAFSRNDFDAALALCGEDLRWWVSGTTAISGTYDKPGIRALFESVVGGTVDGIRVEPVTLTAEEDRVAMEALSDGRTRDGRHYANRYHFLHVVRDGLIREVREYMDPEHVRAVFDV